MQSASVRDNLLYGLKNRPLRSAEYDDEEAPGRERDFAEAARTGNLVSDHKADWVDFEAAGVKDLDELFARLLQVLDIVEMSEDIYNLGLRGTVDPDRRRDIAESALKARAGLTERLSEPEYEGLVEKFDRSRYNSNASVAENLLFGTTVGNAFDHDRMAENDYVLQVLRDADLIDDMLAAGRSVAETMIVEPGLRLASKPESPKSACLICAPLSTMMKTASAFSPTSLQVATGVPPNSLSVSSCFGLRSNPVRLKPFSIIFLAMLMPILPRPMNPISFIIFPDGMVV